VTQKAIVLRAIINLQDFQVLTVWQFTLCIKNYLTFCSGRHVCKNRVIKFYHRFTTNMLPVCDEESIFFVN